MPDADLGSMVTTALSTLAEAVYAFGGGEQLDASALRKYWRRHPLAGWRLTLSFSDKVRKVDILACAGYPWKAFRVALVDGPPFLTWPHIEDDGVICLPQYPGCMTPDETLDILQRALADVTELIERCISGAYASEFRDEFNSYWAQKATKDAPRVTSICDPHGKTRLIRGWISKSHVVVADTNDTVSAWLKNYGITPRNGGADVIEGVFIALKQVPLPREYPSNFADLQSFVRNSDPAALALIEQLALSGSRTLPIVLGVPTPRGTTLAAVMLSPKASSRITSRFSKVKPQQGFRPGHVPPPVAMARLGNAFELTRAVAARADASWIHGRETNADFAALHKATIVIAGCGSVGSAVAELLAKAGVGHLVLIDPQEMAWPNVGRHILGAGGVYRNKAQALKERLLRDFPHMRSIDVIAKTLESVLHDEGAELARANLIIATTAEWSADSMLDDWRASNKAHPPVIYGWTEEHACAGHAVLIGTGDCFRRGFETDGSPLFAVTSWPTGNQVLSEPGCGAVFQPYGPIELAHTATLIAELANDRLLGGAAKSTHRIWAARRPFLERCGGAWSEWWSKAFPGSEDGGMTKECAWPSKPSRTGMLGEAA